jgi:hypothetical protein
MNRGGLLVLSMRVGARASVVAPNNSLLLCLAPRNEVPAERSAVLCGGGGSAACAPLLVRSSLGALSDARGGVMSELLLDVAGHRRSPATLPAFHAGRPLRNKGMRYPADPATIEEIVTVMRSAGDGVHGRRLRVAVRCWCGAARAAGAARSAWTIGPGNSSRPGSTCALSCRSGRCSVSSTAPRGDGPGRPPPPALSSDASPARPAYGDALPRTSCATRTPSKCGITSIYLQGIDNTEIIDTVHARRAPMVPVHSSLAP